MSSAKLICTACGDAKAPADFYADRSKVSGRRAMCKVCVGRRHRDYVSTPRGAAIAAETVRRYYASEHGKRRAREYRRTHKPDPVKVKARKAVYHAVARGKLVRQCCERCGAPDAQAHHEDYMRPLDVRWLCRPCHERHHHAEAAQCRSQ